MTNPLTCIIVDDEPKARKVLASLIELNCPELDVVASCEDLNQARTALLEKDPDIVFLDIQLPGTNGFELIQNMEHRKFAVIFTTAYEQHAVRAFETSAQDYLMKPIHSDRLRAAVDKAQLFLRSTSGGGAAVGSRHSSNPLRQLAKIALPVASGFELFDPSEIVRFRGNGSYSDAYLRNGKKIILSQNLKRIETLVEGLGFFRVHRSHLVNMAYIKRFRQEDGGFVELEDGQSIEVSRRRLAEFKTLLGMA